MSVAFIPFCAQSPPFVKIYFPNFLLELLADKCLITKVQVLFSRCVPREVGARGLLNSEKSFFFYHQNLMQSERTGPPF